VDAGQEIGLGCINDDDPPAASSRLQTLNQLAAGRHIIDCGKQTGQVQYKHLQG